MLAACSCGPHVTCTGQDTGGTVHISSALRDVHCLTALAARISTEYSWEMEEHARYHDVSRCTSATRTACSQ
jgi:hypothetical protein